MRMKLSISNQLTWCFPVLGGTDGVTRFGGCDDAFARAFSVQRNERSWMIVEAAPLIMKCFELDKVRINEAHLNFSEHDAVKAVNHNATFTSMAKEFDGELMKVESSRAAFEDEPVSAPFFKEFLARDCSSQEFWPAL